MKLVRWRNPNELIHWRPMGELDRHLDRLFSDFVGDLAWRESAWAPAIDVKETEDAYILEADLPGMTKDEIDLSVVDNVVTLKGERKREEKHEDNGYRRIERSYGSFQRSFEIPSGFDSNKVKAHYEDGVLRVTLPKREEAKPRRLEVKVK